MNLMRSRHWRIIDSLAAELIAEHSMDVNTLQKLTYYVQAQRPDAESLTAWLNAQIDAAQFFPRSNQTVRYALVNKELVDYLWEYDPRLQDRPQQMAQVLGWLVRLMTYYKANKGLAKDNMPRHAVLHIPKPPRVTIQSRGVRKRSAADDVPDAPRRDEEVSDEAKDFFNRFFGGGDED